MKQLITSILSKITSANAGVGAVAALSGVTALAVIPATPWGQGMIDQVFPTGIIESDPTHTVTTDRHGVKISVKQSQTKLARNSSQEVYLDVGLDIPTLTQLKQDKKPTDLVLVLDRSGSMADDNKMHYAKEAMRTFVNTLGDQDRIALVTFDGIVDIPFPLQKVTKSSAEKMHQVISGLGPGGSTNMGEGLKHGEMQLPPLHHKDRSRRVILLSDGHANTGITTAEGLASLVRSIAAQSAVLSTIGMGLNFNETLLAQLSDYGMGNFTFLESVANLSDVLKQDLAAARAQFSPRSYLVLDIGQGVDVIDAAGYPVEHLGANRIRIPLGQLLEGSKRNIMLTLRGNTSRLGKTKMAEVALTYNRNGKDMAVNAGDPIFATVVKQEREAYASADKSVLQDVWTKNNLGRMKQVYSENIRQGNKAGAGKALRDYRKEIAKQEAAYGFKLAAPSVANELQDLEVKADDAFSGSGAAQAKKQKALSKDAFSSGLNSQRRFQKKK